MIHENSRDAFEQVDTQTARSIVLSTIRKQGKITRQAVADHLGWEINRVTGRVRELLDQGKIKEDGCTYVQHGKRSCKRSLLTVCDNG